MVFFSLVSLSCFLREFPGIIFYLLNLQCFHDLVRFLLRFLNFKHYSFKGNANHQMGDLFSIHNNLELKFHILDILVFWYFF
jgi:hypothetical protein